MEFIFQSVFKIDPIHSKWLLFSTREDLNLLKELERELLADINDTEETIASSEKKCANVTLRIHEIAKLEKIEEDKVTYTFHKVLHLFLKVDFTQFIVFYYRFPSWLLKLRRKWKTMENWKKNLFLLKKM